MRIPGRQRTPLRGDDSMTPLIDVVFLLLIFFVCASVGQAPESLLPTELSDGTAALSLPRDPESVVTRITVRLGWNSDLRSLSIRVEDAECRDSDDLAARLSELGRLTPESPVILEIAPQVPLESVVDVWDVCNRAGFRSINFAASEQR